MTEPGFNLNDTVLISSQWPEKDAQITAALENLQESDVRLSLNTLSEKTGKRSTGRKSVSDPDHVAVRFLYSSSA